MFDRTRTSRLLTSLPLFPHPNSNQVVKEKAGVANVLMETKILRMMDHSFILNLMQTYQASRSPPLIARPSAPALPPPTTQS